MIYYAEKDVNDFVIGLYTPHDAAIPVEAVEITEEAYAKVIASGEALSDFKVVGNDLVIDTASQDATILKEAKQKAYAALKAERLARIQTVLPAIESDEMLEMIAELWLSIVSAAKAPTAEWQLVINIWQAAKLAGLDVSSMTLLANVENYDVSIDPNWP